MHARCAHVHPHAHGTCIACVQVLAYEPLKKHVWGGKGVGSQGDGCAQLLCKSEEDVEAVMRIVQTDLGMSCMPLQLGSHRPVTQALIPAASFSQALFRPAL